MPFLDHTAPRGGDAVMAAPAPRLANAPPQADAVASAAPCANTAVGEIAAPRLCTGCARPRLPGLDVCVACDAVEIHARMMVRRQQAWLASAPLAPVDGGVCPSPTHGTTLLDNVPVSPRDVGRAPHVRRALAAGWRAYAAALAARRGRCGRVHARTLPSLATGREAGSQ